jgi:hypothetical protein
MEFTLAFKRYTRSPRLLPAEATEEIEGAMDILEQLSLIAWIAVVGEIAVTRMKNYTKMGRQINGVE